MLRIQNDYAMVAVVEITGKLLPAAGTPLSAALEPEHPFIAVSRQLIADG
jgi:hypothetical protein